MQGSIMPCRGSVCEHCAVGKYVKVDSPILKTKVPICNKCGELPKRLRVRKTIPGVNGKGVAKDFYYDLNGNRLSDPVDCITLLKQINFELENGTFRPEKFASGKEREIFKFQNFAEEYLKDMERRRKLPDDDRNYLTMNSLRLKKSHMKHLIKHFYDVEIGHISKQSIADYYRSWEDRFRTRDLVLGELKYMLKYAFSEKELISAVPPFPKLGKARIKSSDEIPPIEVQEKIISKIKDPQYQLMIILMAYIPARPCEVRSLRKKDLDLAKKKLFIRSHFSMNDHINGRKSQKVGSQKSELVKELDYLLVNSLLPYLLECSTEDELIFKGPRGGEVKHQNLLHAWNVAQKIAKDEAKNEGLPSSNPIFKHYDLYSGTRHATLTEANKSIDLYSLLSLSGHTNVLTLQRYVKEDEKKLKKFSNSQRFFTKGCK